MLNSVEANALSVAREVLFDRNSDPRARELAVAVVGLYGRRRFLAAEVARLSAELSTLKAKAEKPE